MMGKTRLDEIGGADLRQPLSRRNQRRCPSNTVLSVDKASRWFEGKGASSAAAPATEREKVSKIKKEVAPLQPLRRAS